MRVSWKVQRTKCLNDDVVFAVDDIFDKCNPTTATLIKEVCKL